MKAQCHCRECQYISGGAPNVFVAMPTDGFSYTKGSPKQFSRKDLERPVTRGFCAECGTHLVTLVPGPPMTALKVGTSTSEPPPAAAGDLDHRQAGVPPETRPSSGCRSVNKIQFSLGMPSSPLEEESIRVEPGEKRDGRAMIAELGDCVGLQIVTSL